MNSKKAQVEDWLPMILIIVVFIFVFLFLMFPADDKQEKKEIAEFQSIDLQAEEILITFLRKNYNYQQTEISIAEAIQLHFDNKDQTILNGISLKARDFFSKTILQTDATTWSLEIQDEATNIAITDKSSRPVSVNIPSARNTIAEISIPNMDQVPIRIKLFLNQK